MKTLMYPIAPDDDFPEMFCAIRQGSGEHWFYVPEGESASWMLFRMEVENEKLRELVRDMWEGYNDPRCEECHLKDTPTCADCPICAREAAVIDRMRELGVDA